MVNPYSACAQQLVLLTACTRDRLVALADKYEVEAFSMNDPCRVLFRYREAGDIECAAFLMAILSFGRREQFLHKAEWMLSLSDEHPAAWVADGAKGFPDGDNKFYRFYSYSDIRAVLNVLKAAIDGYGSFGEAVRTKIERLGGADAAFVIGKMFDGCRAVSHTKTSANKRIRMFLRWMVRRGSPVDIGLWKWLSPSNLIIPLDTHVLQSAKRLGLVAENASATDKTARELTRVLQEVWPDDPCKGDYALFGWGIEEG